jgi:hypothetical protein
MKKIIIVILICFLISCVSKKQLLNKNIPSGKYLICSIKIPNKNTMYRVYHDKRGRVTMVEPFKPNNGIEEIYNYTECGMHSYILRLEKIKYRKSNVKGIFSLIGDTVSYTSSSIFAKKRIHFNLYTDSNYIKMYWNNYLNTVAFFPDKYVKAIHRAINIDDGKLIFNNDTLVLYNYNSSKKNSIYSVLKAVKIE